MTISLSAYSIECKNCLDGSNYSVKLLSTVLESLFAETTFGEESYQKRILMKPLGAVGQHQDRQAPGNMKIGSIKIFQTKVGFKDDWMRRTDQAMQWAICFKSLSFQILHLDLSDKHGSRM